MDISIPNDRPAVNFHPSALAVVAEAAERRRRREADPRAEPEWQIQNIDWSSVWARLR